MQTKHRQLLLNLGIPALFAGVIAVLILTGLVDFTTLALDWVHDEIARAHSYKHLSSLNNVGFWSGLYLRLIIEAWLLSSNWWKVILGAIVVIFAAYGAFTLLLSREPISDIEDYYTPGVSCQWTRFYYGVAGIWLACNMDYDSAIYNSIMLMAPLVLILLCQWNGLSGIWPSMRIWLLGVYEAIVLASVAWIAFLVVIYAIVRLLGGSLAAIGSIGSSSGGSGSSDAPDAIINGEPAQRVGDVYYTRSGKYRLGPTGIDFERIPD